MGQNFDIIAQVLAQGKGFGQVAQQLQREMSNVRADVSVRFNPADAARLAQLRRQTQDLDNSLRSTSTSAAAAGSAINRMGSAFGSARGQIAGMSGSLSSSMTSLKSIQGAANSATTAFDKFSEIVGLSARRFLAFGLATTGIVALSRSIRVGIGDAADLSHQMVKLGQVGSDTKSQIAGLQRSIFDLSTNLGVSSKELSESAVVFRQAGVGIKDLSTHLETLAQAALAPNFRSMAQTAEGAIAVLHQFNTTALETRDAIGQMDAVSSAYAVEAGDLVEVVRRSGGAFKAAGGNLTELLGVFTSIRQTTRESSETISSALKTIFARLQRNDTVDQLRALGINLRYTREEAERLNDVKLTNQFKGPFESLKLISSELKSLPTTDVRFASITEAIGGYRQLGKTIPALQQFSIAQEAVNVAQAGSVSLQNAVEKSQASLLIRTQKLKEEYSSLAQKFVDSSSFQAAADTFFKLGSSIAFVLDGLRPLLPLLTTLGAIKLGSGLTTGILSGSGGIARATKSFLQRSTGGPVPGSGTGDHIPALLEPKEFVINKAAAQRIGLPALHALNSGHIRGYSGGGAVGGNFVSPAVSNQIGNTSVLAQVEAEARRLGIVVSEMSQVILGFCDTAGPVFQGFKTLATKAPTLSDVRATSLTREQRSIRDSQVGQNAGLVGSILSQKFSSIRPGTDQYDEARQVGLMALNRMVTKLVMEGKLTGGETSLTGHGVGTGIFRDVLRSIKSESSRNEVALPTGFEASASTRGPLSALLRRERVNRAADLTIREGGTLPEGLVLPPRVFSPSPPSTLTSRQRSRPSPIGLIGYSPQLRLEHNPAVSNFTRNYNVQPPHVADVPVESTSPRAPLLHQLPVLSGRLDYRLASQVAENARQSRASRRYGSQFGPFGSFDPGEYGLGNRPLSPSERLLREQDSTIRSSVLRRTRANRVQNAQVTDPLAAKQLLLNLVQGGVGPGQVIQQYSSLKSSLSSADNAVFQSRFAGQFGNIANFSSPLPGGFSRLGRSLTRGISSTLGVSRGAVVGFGRGAARFGGSIGGPIAAAYAGDLLSQGAGSAESAVAGGIGSETSYGRQKAAGGGLSGLAIGASAGFAIGGPVGSAVGAVTVGLYSFVSSLKEAEKEVRQVKIADSLANLSDKLATLNTNGGTTDYGTSSAAITQLREYRSRSLEKNRDESSGLTGLDTDKFQSLQRSSLRQDFGGQLPQIAQVLSKQAESLGRANAGANIEKLSGELKNGGDGLNRELISIVAAVRNTSVAKVMEEFSKNISVGQRAVAAEKQRLESRVSTESASNSFGRLVLSVESAADVFHRLQTNTESLNDLFHGTVSAHKVSLHGDNLNQLGRNDAGSLIPLQAIARVGGAGGRNLLESGAAVDSVSRILPSILNQANLGSHLEGSDISVSVSEQIRKQLGSQAGVESVIAVIAKELSDAGSKIFDDIKVDVSKLSDRLIEPLAGPVKESGQRISKILEDSANAYTHGLATHAQFRGAVGEATDQTSRAGLSSLRVSTGFAAYNAGNPGKALDLLSLSQLNQPFNLRQSRLAGRNGLNAGAIGSELSGVNGQIAAQQKVVDASAGKPEFLAAANELNRLKIQASDLQQALKHLTDAGERSAGAQEKLSRLEDEKSSRIGLGERYLTGDAHERSQLNRGFSLAGSAAQQGSLKGFTNTQIQLILSSLRSAGSTTLKGVNGAPRANDLFSRLIEGTGFGLDKDQKSEQQDLQKQIAESFKDAEKAMDELRKNQQSVSDTFFASLQDNQAQFLAKLAVELQRTTLAEKQNQAGRAGADLSNLKGLNASKATLSGAGVRSKTQLDALLANRGEIEKLAGAKTATRETLDQLGKVRGAIGEAPLPDLVFNRLNPFETPNGVPTISNQSKANILSQDGGLHKFLTSNNLDTKTADKALGTFAGSIHDSRKEIGALTGADRTKEMQRLLAAAVTDAVVGDKTGKLATAQKDYSDSSTKLGSIAGLNHSAIDSNPQAILQALDAFKAAGETGVSLENLDAKLRATTDQFTQLSTEAAALRASLAPKGGQVGVAHLADGGWTARGTDCIPAMLSPNEFVVNAQAARANMGLLEEINSGGVSYYAGGGSVLPSKNAKHHVPIGAINGRSNKVGRAQGSDGAAMLNEYTRASASNLGLRQLLANASDPGAAFGAGQADFGSQNRVFSDSLHRTQGRYQTVARESDSLQKFLALRNSAQGAIRQGFNLSTGESGPSALQLAQQNLTASRVPNRRQAHGGNALRKHPVGNMVVDNHIQYHAAGGLVTGGAGGGGDNMVASMARFADVSQNLAQAFTQFGGNATALAQAISQMPRSLTMAASHNHNVNLNGAEILSSLMPAIQEMVVAKTNETISRAFQKHLPQAGIPAEI